MNKIVLGLIAAIVIYMIVMKKDNNQQNIPQQIQKKIIFEYSNTKSTFLNQYFGYTHLL